MCQSHTGRLTGLWFLPKPAFGLNTNDDDDDTLYVYIYIQGVQIPVTKSPWLQGGL